MLATWLEAYVQQRYNVAALSNPTQDTAMLQAAWRHLAAADGPYGQNMNPTSGIEHMPSIFYSYDYSHVDFCGNTVHHAADLLTAVVSRNSGGEGASNEKGETEFALLEYDAIDIVRQSADIFFGDLRAAMNSVLRQQKQSTLSYRAVVSSCSQRMMAIISALDSLFSANENFLLGPYLADADVQANSSYVAGNSSSNSNMTLEEVRALMKKNALSIITRWGNGDGPIELSDYASRAWSGMYSEYYAPRWKMFFELLSNATSVVDFLVKNPFWQITKMMPLDEKFIRATASFPVQPRPQRLAAAAQLVIHNLTSMSEEALESMYEQQAGSTVPAERQFQIEVPSISTLPSRLGVICALLGDTCAGFDSNGYLMMGGNSNISSKSCSSRRSETGTETPRFCKPLSTPILWTKKK